jgi:hypothetical protein
MWKAAVGISAVIEDQRDDDRRFSGVKPLNEEEPFSTQPSDEVIMSARELKVASRTVLRLPISVYGRGCGEQLME